MLVQNQQKNLGQIIAKAWSDPIFKERLKEAPRGVLSEMGVATPDDIEIEVVENTARKIYLTLPITPCSEVLSEEDVESSAWLRGRPQGVATPKDEGCCGGSSY